jgi:hypothetical protein
MFSQITSAICRGGWLGGRSCSAASFCSHASRVRPAADAFAFSAVRWRVFHRTVQDIKARNADTDPEELQALIDEAVQEVRAEKRPKGKGDKA